MTTRTKFSSMYVLALVGPLPPYSFRSWTTPREISSRTRPWPSAASPNRPWPPESDASSTRRIVLRSGGVAARHATRRSPADLTALSAKNASTCAVELPGAHSHIPPARDIAARRIESWTLPSDKEVWTNRISAPGSSAISATRPRTCPATNTPSSARRSRKLCATRGTAPNGLTLPSWLATRQVWRGSSSLSGPTHELVRLRLLETELEARPDGALQLANDANRYRSLIWRTEDLVAEIESWAAALRRREQLESGDDTPAPWHRSPQPGLRAHRSRMRQRMLEEDNRTAMRDRG